LRSRARWHCGMADWSYRSADISRDYGRRSTIITSQIPVDKWHELIGDPTYVR
jgi:hypothetical protein